MAVSWISNKTGLPPQGVKAVISLLDEGATVPFIARYRKEKTGNLDEVAIIEIRDEYSRFAALEKRRASIISSMEEMEMLSPKLKSQLEQATTLEQLEDIYLPFKPRVETKADKAVSKGLEPLARQIYTIQGFEATGEAQKYVSPEKGVLTKEDAIAGACDIVSQWCNENPRIRERLRGAFAKRASLISKVSRGKKEEAVKYKDYYDWKEPLAKAPSHRILAIFRGTDEKMLSSKIEIDSKEAVEIISSQLRHEGKNTENECALAIEDSYKRLLSKSIEREYKNSARERADAEAIKLFAKNLRELLLAPPLGSKAVLAVDPGLRTGCKVVCLDKNGDLKENTTMYPLVPFKKTAEAERCVSKLCKKHNIEAIAVGNGTGGREALAFLNTLTLPQDPVVVMVNESGASVYSASETARSEFPDHDITVRGAVSIGRRLMDPLAELVKIDPKAIGVGQYQHDVDQKRLKSALEDVVTICVNTVGVNVNTASPHLLSYVAGLSRKIAENIVTYRTQAGTIRDRKEILKVKGLGKAAFEQCAGFLRIPNGTNLLDKTAVHPESYHVVEKMASNLNVSTGDLIHNTPLINSISAKDYVSEETGLFTINDILEELKKPGRDPRREFEPPAFDKDINSMDDLIPGIKLSGVVTNITGFGAFVDIGVHQDGLVHISEMANRFISDPFDVVSTGQNVTVTVLSVDKARKRISLSMKE